MLIYDVLHKETVYHLVINDLRNYGIKYRFKKGMFKIERPEGIKHVSKKVFKSPLLYQSLDVVSLSSGAIVHVPAFVSQASAFLDKYITQEGLFRKAGSQLRQKELIMCLDTGGALGEKQHAVDVANCLKTFFRELPEPLIPYTYHDLFVHCIMLKTYNVEALLLACILLPPHHLNTLVFFMEFLKKVSLCEKQNKMGIDNLAKVIGPNIMPLQETTMSAVQIRLELHLRIIKVLIENADCIGVLPDHISHAISMESIGSTDNELNVSDHSRSKSRKKKHRSGSLTRKPHLSASNLNLRMFNGLKKIVGKNAVSEDNNADDNQKIFEDCDSVHVSNTKSTKKRKVDYSDAASAKKKKVIEKTEKSKKHRLSLDRFVPRRSKAIDEDPLSYTDAFNVCAERRWSCNACDSQRTYRTYSDGSSQLKLILKENEVSNELHREYNNMFVDVDVNLSDDSDEQSLLTKGSINFSRRHVKSNSCSEERNISTNFEEGHTYSPKGRVTVNDFEALSRIRVTSLDNQPEEYVTIPKSEYEDIKHRVSVIESRLSQEFACITDENAEGNDDLLPHSVKKVQTAYEKTLEESSIENTVTTDYLAKKLGKELKIRRSAEHKIIRSPSARKIGNLRRRSQERTMSKHVRRTASWHISHGSDLQRQLQSDLRLNRVRLHDEKSALLNCMDDNTCLRPISTSFWEQEQSSIILSNVHDDTSNFNLKAVDRDKNPGQSVKNRTHTGVRRISSFHGNEFGSTSIYTCRNNEKLKKTNSQQNMVFNSTVNVSPKCEYWNKSAISWKDAAGYFKSTCQTNSPVTQTGRASIAKLRTQNAGMVLAKAKLFDECTTKARTENCTLGRKNDLCKIKSSQHVTDVKETNEQTEPSQRTSKCIRNKAFLGYSNSYTTNVGNTALNLNREDVEKYYCVSNNRISNQKKNIKAEAPPLVRSMPVNTGLNDARSNLHNGENSVLCKTPHIKKSLTVKTPKSAKTIARKPIVDSRRTPLKAISQLGTPKYQSPKSILKTRNISRHA